jgi:hypothetical protein
VRQAWLGGKKNDVVLVIGAPRFPLVSFARVFAWNRASGAEDEFKEGLATRVQALGTFDGARVLTLLRNEVDERYQRRPFSEFDYLLYRATPTPAALIFLAVLGALVSGLVTWLQWRNQRRMQGAAPSERLSALFGRRRRREP